MPSELAFAQSHPLKAQASNLDDVPLKRARRNPTSRAQLRALAEKSPVRGQYRRQSIFTEVDVDGVMESNERSTYDPRAMSNDIEEDYFTLGNTKPSNIPPQRAYLTEEMATEPARRSSSTLTRLTLLAFLMVIMMPLVYDVPFLGKAGPSIIGAKAGIIRRADAEGLPSRTGPQAAKRSTTSTDVCNRWSQQHALVNGTIYMYGGHTSTKQGQTDNTWTNDFLSMDITKDFNIQNPPIKGLPQPSGIPAVSNGFLWQSYDSLYLYGGEVSSKPRAYPSAYSLWAYDIKNAKWTEHSDPKTSAGNNSDDGNQPVQQAAEGAGVSIPELGRGYYFAGHLDAFTTNGWDWSVERLYLKSMIEYTFPGYTNDGVQSLSGGKTAGDDGVWRNITQGGIQDTAKFTNRADSALVHIPGFGTDGILVSLGGGTNESFSQMNVIDVFDIATSTWYKQSTAGESPILRVNPCAVAASAPDGSSTNIYMYGGQNLIPPLNQSQYGDMWILTIPSFTWIEVDTTGQSVPTPRVGHTCSLYDSQLISIGGYNTAENSIDCDTGVYIFDTSKLTWQNDFHATGNPQANPQNQQLSQQKDPMGLSGSYNYEVPPAVQSVIGGGASGGATITAPAELATAGPLATGKPVTYTVQGTFTITGADGSVVTQTGTTSSTTAPSKAKTGPNIAAIVAGVVAGFFFVLACYLGFCAWVYRRQLALYKNHVAMTQRNAIAGAGNEKAAFLTDSRTSKERSTTEQSSTAAGTSGANSGNTNGSIPPVPPIGGHRGSATGSGTDGMPIGGNSTANSSSEDLMAGREPTFVGVLLNPRRSLRVINRD